MRPCSAIWSAALLALVLIPARHARAEGEYRVVERFEVGGEGGWDILTVDPHAHRLYYGRGTRMQVLDTETGKVVGEIPDTPGIHGVALAPDLNRGFTSNGRDSSVTIFDLKTLAVVTASTSTAGTPTPSSTSRSRSASSSSTRAVATRPPSTPRRAG